MISTAGAQVTVVPRKKYPLGQLAHQELSPGEEGSRQGITPSHGREGPWQGMTRSAGAQVTVVPREKYPLGQTVTRVSEQRERTQIWSRRYLEEQLLTVLAGAPIALTPKPKPVPTGLSRHQCRYTPCKHWAKPVNLTDVALLLHITCAECSSNICYS